MSKVNGNDVGVYVNNQLIGCQTGCTFTGSTELIVATCKDNNGARAVLPGGISGNISFNGNFETAATYGLTNFVTAWLNKTRVGVKQAVDGGYYIAAYAYITGLTWEGPLNAVSTFSGTFEIDGDITAGSAT